jgi:hypothetical protein
MASPLRPELYKRLERRSHLHRFGGVIVAHENEEMVATVCDDWERPGRKKLDIELPGEYYRVNCPYCNDTRHRLWINHRWGLYNEQVRSRNLHLCCCYNEHCLEVYGRQHDLYDKVFNDITNGRPPPFDPLNRGERPSQPREVLPPGPEVLPVHELDDDHTAVVYLRSRGYDTGWLGTAMRVGFCPVAHPQFRTAQGRVIIPVYHNGLYCGWQARYPYHEPTPDGSPKYYTMPGMKKTQLLYNYDVARRQPFAVLTEGPTKVWSVGPMAVAQLGDKLASYQAQLIVRTWQTVVIYLDGNNRERAEEAYDALHAVPRRAIIYLDDGQEPGDFTVGQNCHRIYHEALKQGVRLPMEAIA